MKLKEGIQTWLNGSLGDPIADILAKNSHLTRTQLETLLIDILAENISGKTLTYDEKASLRLKKAKLTRGAFNRTLRQAKVNTVKSIYTVLLLGYLGVLESTSLTPYAEIASKLQEYTRVRVDQSDKTGTLDAHLKLMEIVRVELETSLRHLANPSEGIT